MQKSSAKDIKAKITYATPDLSVFFVENLVRAAKLAQTYPLKKAAGGDNGVTNVKLVIDQESTLYGELTIGDYLVSESNRAHGARQPRLT
jgi:hypothetical protein